MVTSAAYGFLGMVVILMMGFSGLQYRESGPSMAVHAQPCFHTENTDFRKGLELEAGCVSKGIGRLLGKGGKRKGGRGGVFHDCNSQLYPIVTKFLTEAA